MKKIYFLLIFILFTSNVFASADIISGIKVNVKDVQIYFEGFKSKITDKLIEDMVDARKKEKKSESILRICSAIYACSDNEIREIIEDELGPDDLSIKIAKHVMDKTKVKRF